MLIVSEFLQKTFLYFKIYKNDICHLKYAFQIVSCNFKIDL